MLVQNILYWGFPWWDIHLDTQKGWEEKRPSYWERSFKTCGFCWFPHCPGSSQICSRFLKPRVMKRPFSSPATCQALKRGMLPSPRETTLRFFNGFIYTVQWVNTSTVNLHWIKPKFKNHRVLIFGPKWLCRASIIKFSTLGDIFKDIRGVSYHLKERQWNLNS